MPPKRKQVDEELATHPTSIRLPKDVQDDLDTAAQAQKWSRNKFIVEVLRQWQAYWKKAGGKK